MANRIVMHTYTLVINTVTSIYLSAYPPALSTLLCVEGVPFNEYQWYDIHGQHNRDGFACRYVGFHGRG